MMLLMHKDIPVAELSVAYGRIQDVIKVYDENHMPIGTKTEFFRLRGRLLETWNKMRAIPQERQDLRRIEQFLNYSVSEAKFRSMAVSLTDCYWIREAKLPFKWKDVNYHENGFASDFSQAFLYDNKTKSIDINVPDWTTDGALKKVWISLNGKPVLLKFGNHEQSGKKKICSVQMR